MKIIQVSIDELYRLARGEIKTSVQRLRICADTKEGIDSGFYDLLRIAETHPQFLEAIPNVEFEGFIKCFRQYASRVSIDNIHGWTLHYEETLDLDMVPPNLRMVKFEYCRCAKEIIDWPKSLTTMIFTGCTATIANDRDMVSLLDSSMIPNGLQTLKIWRGRLRKRVELPDLSTFPALITELQIYYYAEFWTGVRLLNFPNLRFLELGGNPINHENFDLPSSVEILKLDSCELSTIPSEFPSLLKKLYLLENPISSFELATFPSLTILDISYCGSKDKGTIFSMSSVELPSTLVTLRASGNTVQD